MTREERILLIADQIAAGMDNEQLHSFIEAQNWKPLSRDKINEYIIAARELVPAGETVEAVVEAVKAINKSETYQTAIEAIQRHIEALQPLIDRAMKLRRLERPGACNTGLKVLNFDRKKMSDNIKRLC